MYAIRSYYADRNRNTLYQSQYTQFMGPLGNFNQQLIAFEPTFLRSKHFQQKLVKLTPNQFAEERYQVWDADQERLEAYASEHQISAQAKTLLEANLQEFYGVQFFNFTMNRITSYNVCYTKLLRGADESCRLCADWA